MSFDSTDKTGSEEFIEITKSTMSAEQEDLAIRGPGSNKQASEKQALAIPDQTTSVPHPFRAERRSLIASGVALKKEINTRKSEVQAARDAVVGKPTSLDTFESIRADIDRLQPKVMPLGDRVNEFTASIKKIVKREARLTKDATVKGTEGARRYKRNVRSWSTINENARASHKELLLVFGNLLQDAIATFEAYEQKEQERRRRVEFGLMRRMRLI